MLNHSGRRDGAYICAGGKKELRNGGKMKMRRFTSEAITVKSHCVKISKYTREPVRGSVGRMARKSFILGLFLDLED